MARRIPNTPDLSIELKGMWVDAAQLKLILDALDAGDHVDLVSVQFAPKHLRVWQPGERIYMVAYHPADPSPRISSSFWPTTQARRLVSLETMNAAIARALEQPSDQQPARPVAQPIPTRTEPKEDPQRASVRTYTTPSQPRRPDITDISLSEAVFLVSLLRNNPNQTLGQIAPLSNHQMGMTPYIDADYAVVDILYRRGWITIDPHSPVDAFTWEGNTVTGHYPDAVTWVVSVDHNALPIVKTDLEERFTARSWPKAWRDELPALWAWVARLECIAYLECSLEDHQLPFHAGEKTHRIIEHLLETFTIGQVHNLIWRAARDAGARMMREAIAPQHAANSAVGAVERMGDRARAEQWNLKSYRRDRRLPESAVSHVVFRTILGLKEPFRVSSQLRPMTWMGGRFLPSRIPFIPSLVSGLSSSRTVSPGVNLVSSFVTPSPPTCAPSQRPGPTLPTPTPSSSYLLAALSCA